MNGQKIVVYLLGLTLAATLLVGKMASCLAVDYDLTGRAPQGKADKLVVYSATWCGPCQLLKPTLARLKVEGYQVKIVDIDKEQVDYPVKVLPTLVYYNGDEKVKEETGRKSREHILEVLWKPSWSKGSLLRQ